MHKFIGSKMRHMYIIIIKNQLGKQQQYFQENIAFQNTNTIRLILMSTNIFFVIFI